jgi:uroporphyrinogen III methyltransferase/synthase
MIIPGISSATVIPSSLGIPLTARGIASSVAFLSGHEEDEDKANPKLIPVPQADTLVFLMGLTKLSFIVKSLQKSGWPKETPMMIITNGTKPQEQIVKGTLSTIEDLAGKQNLKPPALILAGKTIEFYKPSVQKTYLHCGTHPDIYKHLGKIYHWPMIDIKPVILSESQQGNLLNSFESTDIIVCTSPYAAEYLIKTLRMIKPFVDFGNKIFAVIGRGTQKALQEYHIHAAMVSQEETAQGLLKAITSELNVRGKRILFPRSSLPNPFLKDALSALGATVDEITIYINSKPPKRELPSVDIEGVIFTSPSTVRNFLTDYGIIPDTWQILAKGPVTLKTLHEAGYSHATSLS